MEKPESVYLITTEFVVNKNKERINEIYKINGIFELSCCYINTMAKFSLYLLTKTQNNKVKISIFEQNVFPRPNISLLALEDNNNEKSDSNENNFWGDPSELLNKRKFITYDIYPDKYLNYYNQVSEWITDNKKPNDSTEYEISIIDKDLFDKNILTAYKYSKDVIHTENVISKEKTKKLIEIADIIDSNDFKESEKYLPFYDVNNTFDKTSIKKGRVKNVLLQAKDILCYNFLSSISFKIVPEDMNDKIYLPENCIIIRCKNIEPYYLVSYLNSKTFQTIKKSKGIGFFRDIEINQFNNLPVIIPNKPASFYKELFLNVNLEENIEEDDNCEFEDLYQKYYRNDLPIKKYININTLLKSDLMDELKKIIDKKAKNNIQSDLEEIKNCIKGKSYKAAIVLTGSVLEAFLIDWLSEINHVNYFENKFPARDKNGNIKWEPGLIDYINAINKIKKPKWLAFEQANDIRDKRNWVHAKYYIKKGIKLDEHLCSEMLESLNEVIRTRWENIK